MALVPVRSFDDYFRANLLLTRLHADGVECYLKDENTVTIDPLLSNAIGGIKLMVREEDYQQVLEVIRGYEEGVRKTATCIRCGAQEFTELPKKNLANAIAAAISLITSSYPIARETEFKCGRCGYTTDYLPEY